MSSPHNRGRRVPPKGVGPRPDRGLTPPSEATDAGDPGEAGARPGSRSANRAAKRAAYGVRPKQVRRGGVTGRQSRSTNTALIVLAIAAVAVAAAVVVLGNPFGAPAASPSVAANATPIPSHGDGTCPTSQPASLAPGELRDVTIETPKGTIVMRIDGSLSPIATGNFVALAECHFYDGIVFHRLVPDFVIQGGDPAGTGGGGPGYSIKDDPITGTYKRGTVAMARTSQPDSQGSQFFIVLADGAASALSSADPGYAILGEVTSGIDVVDVIAAMPNSGEQSGNAAIDPVPMTKVTVSGPIASTPPATTAPSPGASTEASSAASPAATQ